ncbi:hypothetical protein [Actinomadura alba]|uniref:Uncharacterized protein n=1 Tax=Actinomadura alba TaxID=406431 RepID=A0ABR7LSZ7_9ACTN|nr:hypothetical protein [Actinomadura alba]MBC6467590.1 hypothetical protein [Actinomadura alba]
MRGDVLMAETIAHVASDKEYSICARSWFEAVLTGGLSELHEELRQEPRLNKPQDDESPWGDSCTLWGAMSVHQKPTSGGRLSLYSIGAWEKFLKGLSRGPHYAKLEMSPLDVNGKPESKIARISVERLRDDPEWVHFSAIANQSFLNWQESPKRQNDWASLVQGQAEVQRSSFGNVTNDDIGNQTALEAILPHSVWDTILNSRQELRGYSWVTICAAEIAERLGGVDVLRRTGAFYEVTKLSYGGLFLRATPALNEYDDVAVRKVFEALAPVLLSGRTERIRGYEHLKLVYNVDAADYR